MHILEKKKGLRSIKLEKKEPYKPKAEKRNNKIGNRN